MAETKCSMKQLSRADADLVRDLREADEKLARLPEAMLEKDVFITEATLALASWQPDERRCGRPPLRWHKPFESTSCHRADVRGCGLQARHPGPRPLEKCSA